MTSLLTLGLEQRTRQRIVRIASRRRIPVSEVIREAVEAWVERQEPIAAPYEAVADLIGIVNGGNPRRSTKTGGRFSGKGSPPHREGNAVVGELADEWPEGYVESCGCSQTGPLFQ
jgi:hypothetical protein